MLNLIQLSVKDSTTHGFTFFSPHQVHLLLGGYVISQCYASISTELSLLKLELRKRGCHLGFVGRS